MYSRRAVAYSFNYWRLVAFRFIKADAIAIKGKAYYIYSALFLWVTSSAPLQSRKLELITANTHYVDIAYIDPSRVFLTNSRQNERDS